MALLVAIVGSVTGVLSYVLYEADVVSVDASTTLIATSLLCSLVALPIGFAGWRWAQKRRQYAVVAQSAAVLGLGTLGAWIVGVAIALGK